MSILLWVAVGLLSVSFAGVVSFHTATQLMGRRLSEQHTGYDYRGVISPVWHLGLTAALVAATAAVFGVVWYLCTPVTALACLAATFVATLLARRIVPRADSAFYRSLILHSMRGRHAGYVQDKDAIRAELMAALLQRAAADAETTLKSAARAPRGHFPAA